MTLDLDELEQNARAAAEWVNDAHAWNNGRLTPDVVLALIERVRKAEQDAKELRTRISAGMSTLSGAEHVVLTRLEFDALTEACYSGPRLLPAPADEGEALAGMNSVARGDE